MVMREGLAARARNGGHRTEASLISTEGPDALPEAVVEGLQVSSLLEALRRSARTYPDKIALRVLTTADPDAPAEELTYEALLGEVIQAANLFRSLGIGPNDAVPFLAAPTTEAFIAFWGAQVAGGVAPLNPFLSVQALSSIVDEVGAKVVAASAAEAHPLSDERAQALTASGRIRVTIDGAAAAGGIDFRTARRAFDRQELYGPEPGQDDVAAYFPTGGTTGRPKLARITHRNQLFGAYSTAVIHGTDPTGVLPNGLPLFHVGGGVIATTRALLLGQTLVQLTPAGYRDAGVVARFWDLADRHGFTQIIAVPTIFADLLRSYDGRKVGITSFVAGASKLPESLCMAFNKAFGVGIHEGYGMTECSGFCAANPVTASPRAGSGGLPAPFYEVRIADIDAAGAIASFVEGAQTGLVVVRGPAVFSGYTDPAHTRAKFLIDAEGEAWLDTGDLGAFDADGYLWITGRSKDLIIRGGHNIDPQSIEDALLQHPDVEQAAAVGMPDARVGELPVAFIELRPGADVDMAALRAFCAERLPEPAATPVWIRPLALPRTAMNKVFKPELRRIAADQAAETALRAWPDAPPAAAVQIDLNEAGGLSVLVRGVDSRGDRVVVADMMNRLGLQACFQEDKP